MAEGERTSLAKDISRVKPWKSLAVALTDLRRGIGLSDKPCKHEVLTGSQNPRPDYQHLKLLFVELYQY